MIILCFMFVILTSRLNVDAGLAASKVAPHSKLILWHLLFFFFPRRLDRKSLMRTTRRVLAKTASLLTLCCLTFATVKLFQVQLYPDWTFGCRISELPARGPSALNRFLWHNSSCGIYGFIYLATSASSFSLHAETVWGVACQDNACHHLDGRCFAGRYDSALVAEVSDFSLSQGPPRMGQLFLASYYRGAGYTWCAGYTNSSFWNRCATKAVHCKP